MRIKKVVIHPMHLDIQPKHIDISRHLYKAFGSMEMESSAWWVVSLCQKLGGWLPFSLEQIERDYHTQLPNHRFSFNGLVEEGYLIIGTDNLYRVTDEFVEKCHQSSPIESAPAPIT